MATTYRGTRDTAQQGPVASGDSFEAPRQGPKAIAVALLRVATGFIFLWAFLDKTFGLHYSTPGAKSWLNGGSPTKGFLGHVEVGPLQGVYHSIAGNPIIDVLFMLGMLGIGVAVILGIGLRLSAVAGSVLMLGMWLAEFPLAQHATGGAPSGSVNPLVDYHVMYALALIILALINAGRSYGLGPAWARITHGNKFLQ